VFSRSEGAWSQQQKLTPSDGAPGDAFGGSVGLSDDGTIALIGASEDVRANSDDDTGSAYVFSRSEGAWSQQQKLTAADGESRDDFGDSVGLSDDGTTALIGAPGNDGTRPNTGSAYVFINAETGRQNLTTQRTLSATEVTNGSTVTVTVEATFNSTIDDANLVDNINGQGVSADNITITDADGGFSAVTSDPAVDIIWNSQLGGPLDSDSVTVEYEVTIPEDTPVGTTITFDGTVTNDESDGTAEIDGDSSLEVVAEEENEEDGSTIDVTRTVSADEVAPNDQVTVTTEMTGVSGAVSTTSSYDPQVASATVQSVTVNGASANPILSEATANGSTVTLGDVGTDATVRITEELTVGEETDVTHSITGNVTIGETTVEIDPVSVTVADIEPQSVVDEYDTDNDGTISITELGAAGADFASGELTITQLGRIGAEFAS
jgi:hypothetical protein